MRVVIVSHAMQMLSMFLIVFLIALPAAADQKVKGYQRKDGRYVQPHQRTDKNRTQMDNYGSKGNTNPYTGKKGTKTPRQ